MVSIIKVTSVQDTSGNNETTTANIKKSFDGAAKAFAQFKGNGTVAIRTSLNASSLTDNASNDYSVNLTNNMSNNEFCYAISGPSNYDSSGGQHFGGYSTGTWSGTLAFQSSSACRIGAKFVSPVTAVVDNDTDVVCATLFGDLA